MSYQNKKNNLKNIVIKLKICFNKVLASLIKGLNE